MRTHAQGGERSVDRFENELIMNYLVIGTVSAAVFAYELLLLRILTIHYGANFASMIISLALMGFAVSATALFALTQRKEQRRFDMMGWFLIAFAISMPVCYRLSENIHCMPLVVLWDPQQLGRYAANYLVLALPFIFGGFIIGHNLLRKDLPVARVYFANMLGSGIGIGIGFLLLSVVTPSIALHLIPLAVLAVGLLRWRESGCRWASVIATAIVLCLTATSRLPQMSEYKELSKMLLLPDAQIESRSWSPYGYTCVVGSRYLRYAPGLSFGFTGTIPAQKAVFTDGDNMTVVCKSGDDGAWKAVFDSMLDGLPYGV